MRISDWSSDVCSSDLCGPRPVGADRARRRVQRVDHLGSRSREERPMSRMSLFNSPLLLGFDHFERAFDRVQKAQADGYPPYNIEQTSANGLRITRSEEHTSELQSLMRISYAVFCLKKKN